MKLLFLYGPPAVGKLTIGKELASMTGFELIHNHLILDTLAGKYDRDSQEFKTESRRMRTDLVREAAENNAAGIILTYVYLGSKSQDEFIQNLRKITEDHGGQACFVRLYCPQKTLQDRVTDDSRKDHGKIQSVDQLDDFLQHNETNLPILFAENLSIDTSEVTPTEAAERIKAHYGL